MNIGKQGHESYCLETRDLCYQFSKQESVLNSVGLQVRYGSIYGFLGPNGAGKTTTLRLVLGLLKKQQGAISIFGLPFDRNRLSILSKIGSLIESPSLYGHLTAHENLRVLQNIYQCSPTRIPEVLNLVGLPNTGKKRVHQFSLGMKQRLSIAVALFHSPSLLILDEPTNGLDPNGIIEMRELFRHLNQEHEITIIISSHLLSEIEKLVTDVGIIHKGKMIFQGTLEELRSRQQQSLCTILNTDDHEKTLKVITTHKLTARMENGKIVLPSVSQTTLASLNRELVNQGVNVYEISAVTNDLETIFMDLINN